LDAARMMQSLERKDIQAAYPYHFVDKACASFTPIHLKILHPCIHPACGI
jgi:hypothetical protein